MSSAHDNSAWTSSEFPSLQCRVVLGQWDEEIDRQIIVARYEIVREMASFKDVGRRMGISAAVEAFFGGIALYCQAKYGQPVNL